MAAVEAAQSPCHAASAHPAHGACGHHQGSSAQHFVRNTTLSYSVDGLNLMTVIGGGNDVISIKIFSKVLRAKNRVKCNRYQDVTVIISSPGA